MGAEDRIKGGDNAWLLGAERLSTKTRANGATIEVHDGGLVMRYDTRDGVDGLPPGEGAFLACSFWLADNYILQQRFDDARVLFKRLLALQNDLGLLAEEYDPRASRMLGNFP